MKIALAFNHLNPGGITTYLQTLASGLNRHGHKVFIISGGGSLENTITENAQDILIVPINTSSEVNPVLISAHRKVKRFMQSIRPDILHSNSRVTQILAAACSKSVNARRVFTCHGFLKKRLMRSVFPMWGDRVIAISPQVQAHLKTDWNLESRRVDLITHGIEIAENSGESQKKIMREKYGIPSERFVVGVFGRYSSVKGFDRLINAAEELKVRIPDVLIVIAGSGGEYNLYRSMVENSGLNDTVKIYANDSRTGPDIVSAYDVFCAPSRQEGLGLSIMEAMGKKVAVTAADVGGIPLLISHNETGLLFGAGTGMSLTESIVKMYENKDFRNHCAGNAYIKASGMFTIGRMIESTVKCYEKTLAER